MLYNFIGEQVTCSFRKLAPSKRAGLWVGTVLKPTHKKLTDANGNETDFSEAVFCNQTASTPVEYPFGIRYDPDYSLEHVR